MSFYSYKNEGNPRCPGRIGFDGLRKIHEKVCIQVNKVYDSCLQQETLSDVRIVLTEVCKSRTNFVPPFTFVSCRSTTTKGKLVGTRIDRLPDRENFARVRTKVELLVPAFGFCEIPPCEEFAESVCDDIFSLPLFPPQLEDVLDRKKGRARALEEESTEE